MTYGVRALNIYRQAAFRSCALQDFVSGGHFTYKKAGTRRVYGCVLFKGSLEGGLQRFLHEALTPWLSTRLQQILNSWVLCLLRFPISKRVTLIAHQVLY